MRKKVIHILYSGLGGTTDYVFNLIKGDKNKNLSHHILFYGIEKVPDEQLKLAHEISLSVIYIQKKKGYDKQAFKAVSNYLKQLKPKIITLHVNSLIVTCSKYKKAKLLFVEHQANHLKLNKEWIWSILAQKKASKIISLSESYQQELKSKLKFLFKESNNVIIKTGIVIGDYSCKRGELNKKLKIGMISRINHFRDHETLIAAFNQVNQDNIELHLAGNGPLLEQLKKENQNINITFHGNITQELIPSFLNELDIYCHASLGETSSVAIMQAQASSLPIIATNVKGINNVLTNDNCVFVEPKSVTDYKNALELLINDEVKRKELAIKSSDYANKNLSHIRMFDEYKKLFKK